MNFTKHLKPQGKAKKIFIFAAQTSCLKQPITTHHMSSDTSKRYAQRGVSAGKEDITP
jgi:hypothetical protein